MRAAKTDAKVLLFFHLTKFIFYWFENKASAGRGDTGRLFVDSLVVADYGVGEAYGSGGGSDVGRPLVVADGFAFFTG